MISKAKENITKNDINFEFIIEIFMLNIHFKTKFNIKYNVI